MSESSAQSRPRSVVVAAGSTVALVVFTVGVAVLSLVSGHGVFSVGIAVALVVWAVLGSASTWLLWSRSGWARGPIVAIGAVHAFAYGQFGLTQAWAWVGSALAVATVVAVLWPTTTRWLGYLPDSP